MSDVELVSDVSYFNQYSFIRQKLDFTIRLHVAIPVNRHKIYVTFTLMIYVYRNFYSVFNVFIILLITRSWPHICVKKI